MSGVLLVAVPSPTPTAGPPLGMRYLSASLRRAGIEVGVLDLASPHGPRGLPALAGAVEGQAPEILGITLHTETALRAYRLLDDLGPRPRMLRVAGGPHATAMPQEVLDHGFDMVVMSEGEQSLVELVRCIRSDGDPGKIPGLVLKDPSGKARFTGERARLAQLDELASPTSVHDLFPRRWYTGDSGSRSLSASLISSRGCPGQCIFCSNFVTGRHYRFHSTGRVLKEMLDWYIQEGTVSYFFHDDAFTAHRKRLLELCRGMEQLPFRPVWLCEGRADQIDTGRVEAMARAGCTVVIVGIESGDPSVLQRIGKNITLDDAEAALKAVKTAGLRTQANFMLGFPEETAEELLHTLDFMQRIAPLVDGFSSMGIVVPYPGTRLYEMYHVDLGFTDWWLDRERMDLMNVEWRTEETPSLEGVFELHRNMERSVLEAGLVPYSAEVRQAIEHCLEFRRAHNLKVLKGNRS